MKLYSWNVNGIRAVVRKGAIQEFMSKHQPDILCIQETKAQQGQAEIEFEGYIQYWNSAKKAGYSGTAIFTKVKPLKVVNDFPEGYEKKFHFIDDKDRDSSSEGRVIAAEFEDFWLVNVYSINVKDDLSRLTLVHEHWAPAFKAYIELLKKQKPVVICGDLNVAHLPDDLARPKENDGKKGFTKEERQAFEKLLGLGLLDTFRIFQKGNGHYTWWTHWANARARNVGWRIDYFLASKELKKNIKSAKVHPEVMGSDHCPVSLEFEF